MCDSYNAFRFAIDGTVNIDGPKSGGLCSYDNYQITSDFNSLCIGKELLLLILVRRLYKLAVVYRSTFSRATTAMEMSHYYQFKRLLRLWLVEYCMTTTDLHIFWIFCTHKLLYTFFCSHELLVVWTQRSTSTRFKLSSIIPYRKQQVAWAWLVCVVQ